MILMKTEKAIFSPDTFLFQTLLETLAQETQFLLDHDLFDEETFGPKVDEIEKVIIPHYYEHPLEELPPLIWESVFRAYRAGPACQALGDPQAALAWYRVGQHANRAGWQAGENFAESQEPAAICAALAGNVSRARELLTYAARNRASTFTEVSLAEWEKSRQYQVIWQTIGFWIFDLSWLGDWQEVLRLVEIGQDAIEKTRRAGFSKDFREPQLLIEIGNTLAACFLDPTDDGRLKARTALRADKLPDNATLTRSNMLPYLFALSQQYPEINPYDMTPCSSARHPFSIVEKNLNESDFQAALDEILEEAVRRRREFITISSVTVHLRAGGYPARRHQMDLCREVMIKNLEGDRTHFSQPFPNIIVATYRTRKG